MRHTAWFSSPLLTSWRTAPEGPEQKTQSMAPSSSTALTQESCGGKDKMQQPGDRSERDNGAAGLDNSMGFAVTE